MLLDLVVRKKKSKTSAYIIVKLVMNLVGFLKIVNLILLLHYIVVLGEPDSSVVFLHKNSNIYFNELS